jgi:hypothetical protein
VSEHALGAVLTKKGKTTPWKGPPHPQPAGLSHSEGDGPKRIEHAARRLYKTSRPVITNGATMSDDQTITIDGKTYKLADLSEQARAQLANIRFCDERIQQLRNELAVSDTARMGYSNALKRELDKAKA